MSEKRDDTERVPLSQVFAGALAAVTAALIGSTMGVAGTVLGAGLASVISTVGGAIYLRSIKRTTEGVRTVHAKVVGRSAGTTVLVSSEDPDATPGEEVEAEPADQLPDGPPAGARRRWPVLVASTLAAFALGMLVVTGVEWLRGESLSGEQGTTFSGIVSPKDAGGADPAEPTTSTTTPTPADTVPPTTPTSPDATTTDPTTTSTTPPSESSTTTTTTTTPVPPVTTTTPQAGQGGSIPPSN